MASTKPKYQQLADQTQDLLHSMGRPGDRVLSIRDYACRESVSISTAQRVYELLELRGLIESRPRSGYYLAGVEQPHLRALPVGSLEIPFPGNRVEWLEYEASSAWHEHNFSAYFASGVPDPSMAGVKAINRIIRQLARTDSAEFHRDGPLLRDLSLRHHLVKRMGLAGAITNTDNLSVTSGGQEALHIALSAVTSAGDLVAIEDDVYGELIYSRNRDRSLRAYDTQDRVMTWSFVFAPWTLHELHQTRLQLLYQA